MNLKIIEHNLVEKVDVGIRNSFSNFLNQSPEYRDKFLQSSYKTAFDGYSFIGQKDSLNQYETDLLHSFVLSDLQSVDRFPKEFNSFLTNEWTELITAIKKIELQLIKEHNLPFEQLYEEDVIGYMMSCNYYPKPAHCASFVENTTRLSAHSDVSLFTTFPFGVKTGLSYFNGDKKNEIKQTNKMITFCGYYSQFMTNGEVNALNHQVELPADLNSERYSFAIFSIPKPNCIFYRGKEKLNGTDYYKKYLSLF